MGLPLRAAAGARLSPARRCPARYLVTAGPTVVWDGNASPESIQAGQACFGVIREEPPMYIGVGTLVLILIIILIVFLVRRV
jgi:hypothetical protein